MKNIIFDPKNTEIEFIKSKVNFRNKTVLEIGCGDGTFSESIASDSKHWIALDINIEPRITHQIEFLNQDFLKFSAKSKFDLIFLRLSFHELPKDSMKKALIKTKRLLKQGGKIIIIDPTFNGEFQETYNIFYRFCNVEHNNRLMDSRATIDELIATNTILLHNFYQYKSPVLVSDFNTLINFINHDFNYSGEKLEKAISNLEKLIDDRQFKKDFILYDCLNMFILS